MDPNIKKDGIVPTSHVVVPPPVEPPVNSSDPQKEIDTALAEKSPISNTPPIQQPPEGQSLFSQINTPQPEHPSAFQEMNSPLPHQVPPEEKPGRKINTKFAIGALIVLAIVALPTTVYLTQQQQNIKQEAATGLTKDTIVATYNGAITIKDIEAVIKEQYTPQTQYSNNILKIGLDILLERKILEREKTNQKITISQQEINDLVSSTGLPEKIAYYKILRTKVGLISSRNWQVYTIGFWTAPTSDLINLTTEEKASRSAILKAGIPALQESERRLKNNENPLVIAKSIITKNPALNGILAVNGTLITQDSQNAAELEDPKIFYYESSGENQPFYKTLYSMTIDGELKPVIFSDESGGSVIKLVKYHPQATFNSYNDWLQDQKSSVKYIINL